MNKKKIFVIIFIALVVIIIGVSGFITYQKVKEQEEKELLISEIRNSYAPYVMAKIDKKIYVLKDEIYQEIGTIYKGTVVSLVENEIEDTDDIYYQIKNSNYYVDYKDLKEEKDYLEDTLLDHYVVTTMIKTNPTNLYQDDKLMITTNEQLEFDVLLKDNGKYYIKYLNSLYYIKNYYELVNKESVNVLKDISVLNFSDTISNDKLREVLKYLKENNYDTITITDFKRWINGQVDLENNKVLLISYKELDEEKKKIVNDYGFTINTNLEDANFIIGDTKLKVGDTKYYKYEVTSTTTINRVKDMLKGIKEVKVNTNSSSGVAVLNYHFFYDGASGESCNESICLDISNFRKQLEYLKNNNYKILTMQEFNDWMDNKITLNQKAVLITVDDGAMGTSFINGNKLIPILEEYQVPATLFLITGWWDANNYESNYLEVYSHGDELHHNNYCKDGKCGYKGLLLSKDELVTDLNISINKLGKSFAFCYPFYAKNNTMVDALKETGFKLAFVGGNRKAKQTDNKYNIPRYIVYKNTSLNSFINMVK